MDACVCEKYRYCEGFIVKVISRVEFPRRLGGAGGMLFDVTSNEPIAS